MPFLADVGLRIGEAAALRWRDVDTTRGLVVVREVLVEVRGVVTLGPPKTAAGRRTVPIMTREVAARLEAKRAKPDDYVFAAVEGGPLRPTGFRSQVWHNAVGSADLSDPAPTPHSLGHTAVAHWIAAGVDLYKLAKWPATDRRPRSTVSTGTSWRPMRPTGGAVGDARGGHRAPFRAAVRRSDRFGEFRECERDALA